MALANGALRWLRRPMEAQITAATAIDKLPDLYGRPCGMIFVGEDKRSEG